MFLFQSQSLEGDKSLDVQEQNQIIIHLHLTQMFVNMFLILKVLLLELW